MVLTRPRLRSGMHYRSSTYHACASRRILTARAHSRLSSYAPGVVMKRNVAHLGIGATIVGSLFYILYSDGNAEPLSATPLHNGSSETSAAAVHVKRGAGNEPGTQDEGNERGIAMETTREAAKSAQAWDIVMAQSALARDSIANIEWPSFPDNIPEFLVPEWARLLPGHVSKLQREISMEPDSLAQEVWEESEHPGLNPEILWSAAVRVSNDLCDEEKSFLRKRREFTRAALAKYLDLPDGEVHPDDVPIIAMCGSGGGLRALVAGTGSYLAATEAGLFDCVTYTAGVSGNCWLQSLYYSSLAGQKFEKLVDHLKARLGVHIAFPPTALNLLNTAPTNKYLLRGLVEQLNGDPDGERGLVDIYGLLLAARLLVPRGELDVRDVDLKVSSQRAHVDTGLAPMPIYTAVRHEIPLDAIADTETLSHTSSDGIKERAKREAWFQWFEFSPYEMWCEELEAGIPTWAVGRQFQDGKNILRENGLGLPERKLPSLMGIWGSAFCATLSHYYKEVRPVLSGMGFGGLDRMIGERNNDLIKIHPINPASIPNYVLGMKDQLPSTCPGSIFKATRLQLMDAGMSNNLPIYPLLRPGRNVDIVIAFDASANIKTENWLSQVDGYARQRGIKGWPIGAGWPKHSVPDNTAQLEAAQASSSREAAEKLEQARDDDKTQPNAKEGIEQKRGAGGDLGYCAVWAGTTEERRDADEPPRSTMVEEDKDLMGSDGIAVVYFPFIPNEKVADVDPNTSDFLSTWNFVYTAEQIDKSISLARANFEEGREKTRRTVRAVYERKKRAREEKELSEKRVRWRTRVRLGTWGRKGEGDHGDHFS
ncbi:MAG: hypothetical protein M1840_007418 [Geoglossum simile]|nr:MAG: hypothetical protein M1840_007418 [Geoglossum simile]